MNQTQQTAIGLSELFKETAIGAFPENWEIKPLGELFDVQQGKALSQKARAGISPRPFLRTSNVLWGKVDLTTIDQMDFTEEEVRRLSLKPGDLLICEGGEIGRSAVWSRPDEGICYQNHVHRLRRKDNEIAPDFVMYWMQAAFLLLRLYGGVGNKTTIPNLSGNRLKQLLIPVPPLLEQRALVAVLTKIQAAVEVQDKIVATLKELKAATMAKLFREGLRGEPLKQTEIGEIPESWGLKPIGELFEIQLGKMLSPKARSGRSPVPYLRNANVQWGRIDFSDLYEMDFSETELEKFSLRPGDLLVCEGGEVGRTAIWNGELEKCSYQKALHRLRPIGSQKVLPKFYMYWAEAAFTVLKTHATSEGTKTTIAHLPAVKLASLLMPVPSLEQQHEIVRIFDVIDVRMRYQEERCKKLKMLFSSMLHLLMTGRVRVNDLDIANRKWMKRR